MKEKTIEFIMNDIYTDEYKYVYIYIYINLASVDVPFLLIAEKLFLLHF